MEPIRTPCGLKHAESLNEMKLTKKKNAESLNEMKLTMKKEYLL